MSEPTEKKRVLLTGATGRIGTAFRRYAGNRYRLRLGVHHLEKLTDAGGHEVIQLEIADLASCREACRNIDVVVHLAATASPRAEFYPALLENNIKGTYNIFHAAKEMGCQRVVFASSVQAVDGYPPDVQLRPDSAVCPMNLYGVSKCFGEALACYFGLSAGLSSIAIRIGSFEQDWGRTPVAHTLSKFISQRDMSLLLERCIEVEDVRFAIVHGVSENRFKRLDLTETRELLDYYPEDDAFTHFEIGLQYGERWPRR